MRCDPLSRISSAVAFAALLAASLPADAIFRAYVASDGSDANPCTLSQPCRLLPAALAVVDDGGEIWMLDSANFNAAPVNITKSVTILAVPGALGSVVAISGNAINIATAGVRVALRNLVIVPFPGGGGVNGVNMTAGTALTIEDCVLANLGAGVFVSTAATVTIVRSTLRDNTQQGLWTIAGGRVTVTRSTVVGNNVGLYAYGHVVGPTRLDVDNTTFADNGTALLAFADVSGGLVRASLRNSRVYGRPTSIGAKAMGLSGGTATLSVSDSVLANHDEAISSYFSGARVVATGNTLSGNSWAFYNNLGTIESLGDNAERNNATSAVGAVNAVDPS